MAFAFPPKWGTVLLSPGVISLILSFAATLADPPPISVFNKDGRIVRGLGMKVFFDGKWTMCVDAESGVVIVTGSGPGFRAVGKVVTDGGDIPIELRWAGKTKLKGAWENVKVGAPVVTGIGRVHQRTPYQVEVIPRKDCVYFADGSKNPGIAWATVDWMIQSDPALGARETTAIKEPFPKFNPSANSGAQRSHLDYDETNRKEAAISDVSPDIFRHLRAVPAK